ncbi:HAD-IA family hydrolase [Priestia megaterium]|uniref:HAD-IA family hydrolase n=1 Tax=Priestia megaterium TaxID=1404 RepID=UPI0012B9E451|nr:HAD-IA family hydrolase [Priestia megaterium]
MNKVILFNFNGTIVNTKLLALDIYNRIAEKDGYKKMDEKEIPYLSTLSIRDRCKILNVPIYKMPVVGLKIKQRYQKHIPSLNSVPGINELVHELKQRGFRLGFLTSNSRDATTQFLRKNSIDVFDYKHYSFNPFSKTKDISSFLKSNGLNANEIIYIGDEVRDIKASKKNQVCSIGAGWGYDSVELLKKGEPDYIAEEPNDILTIVTKL